MSKPKKYDANKTLALELFELHQMYEDMGETKTNLQLRQLIRDANPDTSAADGIDYKCATRTPPAASHAPFLTPFSHVGGRAGRS